MRPTRYYLTVLPVVAVLYLIGLLATDSVAFAVVGAIVILVVALAPTVMIRLGVGPFRGRDRTV